MKEFKYVRLVDIVDDPKYPFTMGQLRTFLLKREENGLDKAIRRVEKCVYIRTDLFDEWIESYAK